MKVTDIISRKKQGQDCTEAESAEIKGWLRDTIIQPETGDQQIVEDIQQLFPQEYAEYFYEDINSIEYKGKKYRAPKVLLSGNHKKIAAWRQKHPLGGATAK